MRNRDGLGQASDLLGLGQERGYVTYAEIGAVLSPDQTSRELIEETVALLSEMRIEVIGNADATDHGTKWPRRR